MYSSGNYVTGTDSAVYLWVSSLSSITYSHYMQTTIQPKAFSLLLEMRERHSKCERAYTPRRTTNNVSEADIYTYSEGPVMFGLSPWSLCIINVSLPLTYISHVTGWIYIVGCNLKEKVQCGEHPPKPAHGEAGDLLLHQQTNHDEHSIKTRVCKQLHGTLVHDLNTLTQIWSL